MTSVLLAGADAKGECCQGENPQNRTKIPFRPPITHFEPATMLTEGDILDVQVGSFSTHVLYADRSEVTGGGYFGQWCNGTHSGKPAYTPNITKFDHPTQVSTVGTHTIALTAEGPKTCGTRGHAEWGDGSEPYVGEDAPGIADSPRTPVYHSTPLAVIAGSNHMAILNEDGTAELWGYDKAGSCGDGTFTPDLIIPTRTELDGIQALALGGNFTLALREDGTVWGVGRGHVGQLGQPLENKLHATARWLQIPKLEDVVAVAAAGSRSAAVTGDGQLYVWGEGSFEPTVLSSGIAAVSVGCYDLYSTLLALDTAGNVYGTGQNPWGQLGDGTRQNKKSLVGLGVTADVIRAGETHSAILRK